MKRNGSGLLAEVKHFKPIGTDHFEYYPEDDENDGDD